MIILGIIIMVFGVWVIVSSVVDSSLVVGEAQLHVIIGGLLFIFGWVNIIVAMCCNKRCKK